MDVSIFIPIVLFIIVFGIFYVYLTARNRERMAIIEKGTEFDLSMIDSKRKFDFKTLFMRLGFLCVGVGVGIVVATILDLTMHDTFHPVRYSMMDGKSYPYLYDGSAPLYISLLFIFGGLGLILGYLLGKKKEK